MARKKSGKNNISKTKRTNIKQDVLLRLWTITAGRCEICNKLLYVDSNYGADGNFAENAHIHAVATNGPRHNSEITQDEINNIENLMLLCAEHHHLIDTKSEDFSVDYLKTLKKKHEDRIRRLTDIREDASCKMVAYFSNIDDGDFFCAETMLKRAVVADGMYPKQDMPILLSEKSSTRYTVNKEIIIHQTKELEEQVRINFGSFKKDDAIALFAIAPQVLLFKLGTLLCDQLNIQVFQCHRNGDKWIWPKGDNSKVEFEIRETRANSKEKVALVIDLSAEVIDERITAKIGEDCYIYHITIREPNRHFVKNKQIQEDFVVAFRTVMEKIKNQFPLAKSILLFPAMPQSLAIRAGMDYMPKADLPVTIYEQTSTDEGFVETITIGEK